MLSSIHRLVTGWNLPWYSSDWCCEYCIPGWQRPSESSLRVDYASSFQLQRWLSYPWLFQTSKSCSQSLHPPPSYRVLCVWLRNKRLCPISCHRGISNEHSTVLLVPLCTIVAGNVGIWASLTMYVTGFFLESFLAMAPRVGKLYTSCRYLYLLTRPNVGA